MKKINAINNIFKAVLYKKKSSQFKISKLTLDPEMLRQILHVIFLGACIHFI